MVDSSIGGKTGVDHGGKNKTGAFYQPRLVVADPSVLSTLDERVYTEGFGEVAKYAMLDANFMPQLEEGAEDLRRFSPANLAVLGRIVARCVDQKSRVIASDPHEKNPDGRILLNYGHTLGHGLEAAGRYTELLHGEAVTIGMTYAAKLAVHLGLTEQAVLDRQTALLESLGLPTAYNGAADVDDIMRHILKDKKNTSQKTTRFVLPRAVGQMVVWQVNNAVVRSTTRQFLEG
jgi:3-dehydroquinate synthase